MNKLLISITLLLISFSANAINNTVTLSMVRGCSGGDRQADIDEFEAQMEQARIANPYTFVYLYAPDKVARGYQNVIPLISQTVTKFSEARNFVSTIFAGKPCIRYDGMWTPMDRPTLYMSPPGTGYDDMGYQQFKAAYEGNNNELVNQTMNIHYHIDNHYYENMIIPDQALTILDGLSIPPNLPAFNGAFDTIPYPGTMGSLTAYHGSFTLANFARMINHAESQDTVLPISVTFEYLGSQIQDVKLEGLAKAIEHKINTPSQDNKVVVASISMGRSQGDIEGMEDMMDFAMNNGIIPVSAAGNADARYYQEHNYTYNGEEEPWRGRAETGVVVGYFTVDANGKYIPKSPHSSAQIDFLLPEDKEAILPTGDVINPFTPLSYLTRGQDGASSLATAKVAGMFAAIINATEPYIKPLIDNGALSLREAADLYLHAMCVTATQIADEDFAPEYSGYVERPRCGVPDMFLAANYIKQRAIDLAHPPGQYANDLGHFSTASVNCPSGVKSFSGQNVTLQGAWDLLRSKGCIRSGTTNYFESVHKITNASFCFNPNNTGLCYGGWYPYEPRLNVTILQEYLPAP